MSTLTPFFDSRTLRVEFIHQTRPVVTVENSTYSNAKTCGIINSAVGKLLRDTDIKLNPKQIMLLNEFCCTLINMGDVLDLDDSKIVMTLYSRMMGIWI